MCYITYHYQVTVEYLSFWEYGNPFLIKSAMFIRHSYLCNTAHRLVYLQRDNFYFAFTIFSRRHSMVTMIYSCQRAHTLPNDLLLVFIFGIDFRLPII